MHINIVLTGYYYKFPELYQKIICETKCYSEHQFNLYILSHKTKEEIPKEILKYLIENKWKIIYQYNIGWDWGCHVQYMKWHAENIKYEPDYILFMHDDIRITKNGFINSFLNKTKQGYELIGNSAPFTNIIEYEKNYSDEAYILKKNGIEYESGNIEIVRGSALFLSFCLAKQSILNLPYQKCGNINLANRSLRMFGAMITKIVGKNNIGYLSNKHFMSDYITEEMRGGNDVNNILLERYIMSYIIKMFLFSERIFISTIVLRHSYPILVGNKLKINFTEDDIKQGYLNICLRNDYCSDIDINEFDKLLSDNRIYKVVISSQIVFNNTDILKSILIRIPQSAIPIDIFIDNENINRKSIKRISKIIPKIKINIEIIRKGIKIKKRLFIKYPQHKYKYIKYI